MWSIFGCNETLSSQWLTDNSNLFMNQPCKEEVLPFIVVSPQQLQQVPHHSPLETVGCPLH